MQNKQINNANDEYEKHVAASGGEYVVRSGKYENLIAKILCVAAAIVLWFYVVITDTAPSEKIFTGIEVDLKNLEVVSEKLGLSAITGYGNTIDVTVLGTKSELSRLSIDDINAWVDIGDVKSAGEYTFEVKTSLPAGISLGGMSVNYISVYMDRRATVSVPIEVLPYFTIESSYTLGTPELSIDTVNVSGPAEELAQIDHARVTLDLGKVTKSMTSTGTLELIDRNGAKINNSYIKLQNTEVTVYYPLYTYKDLPLAVSYKYNYFNSSNVKLTISPSAIRVKGDPDVLDRMESILLMQIDEKKITSDTTQSVTIMLPGDVENVSGVRTADVSIVLKGTTTRTMEVSSFQVNNPNNLIYTLVNDSINVTFRGTGALLGYLSPYNVRANIDLGYLNNASGTVEVPVTFTMSDDISGSVYEIGDYKMKVTISKGDN